MHLNVKQNANSKISFLKKLFANLETAILIKREIFSLNLQILFYGNKRSYKITYANDIIILCDKNFSLTLGW